MNNKLLNELKLNCLVYDIETSSNYSNGQPINLRTNYEDYINNAQVKWFGCYSYKTNKQYYLNPKKDLQQIFNLLESHSILIGFNSEEFDFPILVNNGFTSKSIRYLSVDCMQVLGLNTSKNRNGFAYKNRGELMKYDFKKNSLEHIAEVMKLECQKGKIDFKIFEKDKWTELEEKEIKQYLQNDVMATKQMFDKLWEYWMPFTELLSEKEIINLSWIRSSIASLTYKSACYFMGEEPTYSEQSKSSEEMGGKVLLPKYEEINDVWYVDFQSLYPHIFCMFNLFNEKDQKIYDNLWHGNDFFEVKGHYDVSNKHILAGHVSKLLKQRVELKAKDEKHPMVYCLKIFLNCFSSDTNVVMANNSIKNIKDCKIDEYVWSINPKTLYPEKKKIINTFEYDYNGDLHYYKGHYFDFKVTPNHKFLLQHKNNKNDLSFYESKDIVSEHKIPIHKPLKTNYKKSINILNYLNKENCLYSIKPKNIHGRTWLFKYGLENIDKKYNVNDRNFIYKYDDIKNKEKIIINDKEVNAYILDKNIRRCDKIPIYYDNNALSYLIGVYLSEGSLSYTKPKKYENGNYRGHGYHINLAQYRDINPIIYKKITDALDKCNLKYSAGKQTIKISGSLFYQFIKNNFGYLDNKHIKNKNMFNDLNLKKVFEGLIDGDGTKKSHLYTTKYDCLRDNFIELCIRLGYTFCIKNDGCWRITYNNNANSFRKANRKNEEYNGKVYCLEIEDNHTLLAGRNGKYNWSGNSLYGVVRGTVFEKVHTPNAGWDCCWLGQQIHEFVEKQMIDYGFEIIQGDTDSLFCKALDEKNNNIEYVKKCLNEIVMIINDNVPFPIDTFKLNIETYIDYLMCPFSEQTIIDETTGKNKKEGNRLVKERKGLKKNYLYIYKNKEGKSDVKLVGLPIIKSNATKLGIKIYEEVLKPKILEQKTAKFKREFVDNILNEYLQREDILKLIAREFKVNPAKSYKLKSQIQSQISQGYLDGGSGVIELIKNNKVGKAGKGQKYCTIKEAIENKLTYKDIDLEKVYNEIEPFIKFEPELIETKQVTKIKNKSKS